MARPFYKTPRVILDDVKSGTAADAYGVAIAMDLRCSMFTLFINAYAAIIKTSPDGINWGDEYEISAGLAISRDLALHSFNIKNKTAGQNATYQMIGSY
jgi:hypothetical protein